MALKYGTVIKEPIARFTEKYTILPNGCWQWTAGTAGEGYGSFYRGRSSSSEHGRDYAHRWSYEHHVGKIPEGMVVDHLCRNRRCVNPDHLEAVTQQTNVDRGHGNGKQTHCPAGHPYAGENLYFTPKGGRQCRECKRAAFRRFKEKNILNNQGERK